jgi:hypothetical protein
MVFTGLAGASEGVVGAGLDSIITQDGRIVGFASEANVQEDYELEGIRTLGFYGDRFFKSMGYTANMNVGTYLLRARNEPGALYTTGWQPDGSFNLNTAGAFDFAFADLGTLDILLTCLSCKNSTIDTAFPARGLNTKQVSWRVSRVIPGLETS